MLHEEKAVPVITFDGAAGTGKGTVAQLLAQKLGWHYLDSGAIYRALALAAHRCGLDASQLQALVVFAVELKLEFVVDAQKGLQVELDGQDVTQEIRSPQCAESASELSQYPELRAALLTRQRAFRQAPGLVTDGRDMGTVVFADAPLKFFLQAGLEERAHRRHNQLREQGVHVNIQDILQSLAKRDARDQERVAAPLKPAADAIVIDTTHMTLTEVFAKVLERVSAAGFCV